MKRVWRHVMWFQNRIIRDRLDSSAAHSSFFLMISFFPFCALLLTLMQRIHFSDGLPILEAALDLLPEQAGAFVRSLFPDPLSGSGVLPIAIITALWTSATGMVAVIKGLEQIYRVKKVRNYFHMRLVAMLYVLALLAVIVITAALLVFGSTIYRFLLEHSPSVIALLLMNLKSLVGFVLLLLFFTLMYTFLPRRRVKLLNNLIGACVGAGGWVLFSYFFSLFVERFANYSIFGSLATLVILMYWLFFCMYILFFGAEVAMWLETSTVRRDIRLARKRRRAAKLALPEEKTEETRHEENDPGD